jgi:hypothetical protein
MINLDNYDGLFNPKEHVHNMRSSLELVVQDSKATCKFQTLKPGSISSFSYLFHICVTS